MPPPACADASAGRSRPIWRSWAMPGEWRQISSGGLCHDGLAELQTGPFESQLHAHDYVADGVAVVPTEAIRGRQLDRSVLPRITSAKAKSLERHRLKAGDILVAR